jgi:hypothetical protein
LTSVAIVGSSKGINEGEVYGFSNAAEEMILRDEVIQRELII